MEKMKKNYQWMSIRIAKNLFLISKVIFGILKFFMLNFIVPSKWFSTKITKERFWWKNTKIHMILIRKFVKFCKLKKWENFRRNFPELTWKFLIICTLVTKIITTPASWNQKIFISTRVSLFLQWLPLRVRKEFTKY